MSARTPSGPAGLEPDVGEMHFLGEGSQNPSTAFNVLWFGSYIRVDKNDVISKISFSRDP